jgi:hypothetical protein
MMLVQPPSARLTMPRDPRRDPAPLDLLITPGGDYIWVDEVHPAGILWHYGGFEDQQYFSTPDVWRSDTANDSLHEESSLG